MRPYLLVSAAVVAIWGGLAALVFAWHAVVTHAPVVAFAVLALIFVGACWRATVLERASGHPGDAGVGRDGPGDD